MNIRSYLRDRPFLIIFLIVLSVVFIDLSNLDAALHKGICILFGKVFIAVCPDYYDLPIWEVTVAFGTLTAAYYAYSGIRESNKRLRIEQEPDVRLKDRIATGGTPEHLHTISLKNFGKGRAVNITATADPEGKISIIEGSNPHSIDLGPGDYNNGWAIDESQAIKGLAKQGINVESVVNDIPDENQLKEEEKHKAEFHLYLWYEDQLGNKYRTTTKIRRSGIFFKIMENKVKKI